MKGTSYACEKERTENYGALECLWSFAKGHGLAGDRLRARLVLSLAAALLGLIVFLSPMAFGNEKKSIDIQIIIVRVTCTGVEGIGTFTFSSYPIYKVWSRWLEGEVTANEAVAEMAEMGAGIKGLADAGNTMILCDGKEARLREVEPETVRKGHT